MTLDFVFLNTSPYIFKAYIISECDRNQLLAYVATRKSILHATACFLGLAVISPHLAVIGCPKLG